MIYNFRIDRSKRPYLKEQLLETNMIFQGWGEISLSDDQFVRKTKEYYQLRSTRIPNNLKRIQSFRDGDTLLIPHFPQDGCATILVIDGDYPNCYRWHTTRPHHLQHGIKIRQAFGLDANISMYHHSFVKWYGKLSGLRLPIIPIHEMEETVDEIIDTLIDNPATIYEKSTMDDYMSVQVQALLDSLRSQLYHLNPSNSSLSFEKVCENLIEQFDYFLAERNCYDGEGGDADLVFKKETKDSSPFEIGESYLFVQVKKHKGTTDEHAVKQLIKIMDSKKEYTPANGCVITLADTYSEKAITMAEDAGIKLINGFEFCKLLASNALEK